MHEVTITLQMPDDHYRAFVAEAMRRGTRVETLVQEMMQNLLTNLEREEKENAGILIVPS